MRCAASQAGEALPSLPVITDQSSVAILSKRTTDGILRPVSAEAAMGAMSDPVRGTEVMKQTTKSERRSLSRETIRAGRRLSPERLVKGKRARTMLPNANTYPADFTRSASV